MPNLTIGTAAAKPGQITTGWLDASPLPDGSIDRFPIIIARGKASGPTFWITTGMHGTEHTGPIVVQELMSPELPSRLKGTLIAVPALNPAGLRTKQRLSYTAESDPNRLFPKPGAKPSDTTPEGRPRADLELAFRRLFDTILSTQPVALLDLHNASIGSIPFTLRDPVFYHAKRGKSPTQRQALALEARTRALADAVGFTTINEFVTAAYVSQNLDRSVSGSLLNAGVPALTLELGSWMFVDAGIVQACQAGLRNALRWAGMLGGPPEPVVGIPVVRPGYAVRRDNGVYAPVTGIVHHLVRPGEIVARSQPLARMTDIFGHPLGDDDGLIRAEQEGFVYAWSHGVVRYRGETIMGIALRDKSNMVVPYPD